MNVEFSWRGPIDRIEPSCKVSSIYKDGFCLIDCVLMDDGGISYTKFILWLKKAARKIEAIKNDQIKSHDWGCETWGVKLTKTEATVYSQYDEKYFQIFNLVSFEEILLKWISFVEAAPDLNKTEIFKVN